MSENMDERVQDPDIARHMAEAEDPHQVAYKNVKARGESEVDEENPQDFVPLDENLEIIDDMAWMASESVKKDIAVLGEPEYAKRKKELAQIAAENPKALKYLEALTESSNKEVAEWLKTPEGQQTSKQIKEIVGDCKSLEAFYYDRGSR